MQLLDVDDVHGLRAAVTTFASAASSLRFVLVPVSPLGEPAHYEAVRDTLRSCDLVVSGAPLAAPRDTTRVRDLEWDSQWERLGRGRHIRLSTPPRAWDGVDRPFIRAPALAAVASPATPVGAPRAPRPLWLVALEPLRPLVAMVVSRVGTRVMLAQVLAVHASEALGPDPSGRGLVGAFARHRNARDRLDRELLAAAVRQVHSERHGQALRVAVVHWAEILPVAARALGALGYSPGDPEWITVFTWLRTDDPGEGPPAWVERVFHLPRAAPTG
jgi:hypothetical protein